MAGGLALMGGLLAGGCRAPRAPYPESFNSFDPSDRSLAAKYAAQINDQGAIPLLVDRLEDEDGAVRFFAILALEKLTGTRLGYDYAADPAARARAVERWRARVAQGVATGSAPASAPAPPPSFEAGGPGR